MTIKIGELAKRTGATVETIRYYEKLGLIRPAYRRESNYREYSSDATLTLRFIQKAKDLGFTLSEIKEIIGALENQSYSCNAAGVMTRSKINQINKELERLNQFKARLIELAQSCDTDAVSEQCRVFEKLWSG